MMSLKDILTLLIVKTVTFFIGCLATVFLLIEWARKGSDHFKTKPRPKPPALLEDPKYGTHRYVQLPEQGIRMHYVEKGDKESQLLLCVHGFPECWFSYKSILEEFSSKFWVVAIDARGYGDSDKPSSMDSYKTECLAEDIRELVQVLGKDKKAILMAHDWGGILAWMVTTKYPDLFEKHISLNGPHPSAFTEHRASSWSQMKKSWYILFFQNWYLPELLLKANDLAIFNEMFQTAIRSPTKLTDDEVEVYKYYYSQPGALTPPINYYRKINLTGRTANLGICKVDSLVVWGVDDTALDRQMADKTHKYCEKLQIEYIMDCGHFVLHERPEEVKRAVWKFLDN